MVSIGIPFSKSNDAYEVTHIFVKANDVKQYTELIFMDDSANIEELPEEIKRLLAPELLGQ